MVFASYESLAFASDDSTPSREQLIVIQRDEFELILGGVDHLRQDRDNLEQQLTHTQQVIEALKTQEKLFEQQLTKCEEMIKKFNEEEKVYDEEIAKLRNEIDSKAFWSQLKDYGLITTGTATIILLLLL